MCLSFTVSIYKLDTRMLLGVNMEDWAGHAFH